MSNPILPILLILIIIFIIFIIVSFSGEDCTNTDDNVENAKILYSYGLFSNDPMSSNMKKTIKRNRKITNLDHEVIGAEEVEKDLQQMEKEVPGIINAYGNIPRGVAKSDIARIVSVYLRGGHYADLDAEFSKLPPIKEDRAIVYTETIGIFAKQYKKPFSIRIANYGFSSPAKHPFLLEVAKEIVKRVNERISDNKLWDDGDVLYVTGPDVITSVYHDQSKRWNTKEEKVTRIGLLQSRSIIKHKCFGTWRDNKDTKRK